MRKFILRRVKIMTKYREILRLKGLGFSERNIALSVPCSRNTVSKVLKCAEECGISWPLSDSTTDGNLEKLLSPSAPAVSSKRMPDFAYIRKELLKNGGSRKLLWTEYIEDCRQAGDEPLMYSQFCYYIQQDENKRRATMHINRKPAEQVEVDWAGDTAELIDPYTGEIVPAYILVGVTTYSQYAYVEAFPDEKQQSWIDAHVHMYEYFGGVAKILVPDNCKTAVIHNGGWKDQRINTVYHEMAGRYGTAIIPARVRTPKDKPNAEGTAGNISTWITAALRKGQFFTIAELNAAIRVKLEEFNNRPFQKKEGCRYELFHDEAPSKYNIFFIVFYPLFLIISLNMLYLQLLPAAIHHLQINKCKFVQSLYNQSFLLVWTEKINCCNLPHLKPFRKSLHGQVMHSTQMILHQH